MVSRPASVRSDGEAGHWRDCGPWRVALRRPRCVPEDAVIRMVSVPHAQLVVGDHCARIDDQNSSFNMSSMGVPAGR
jgi:hypothetical protein